MYRDAALRAPPLPPLDQNAPHNEVREGERQGREGRKEGGEGGREGGRKEGREGGEGGGRRKEGGELGGVECFKITVYIVTTTHTTLVQIPCSTHFNPSTL